MIRGVTNGDDAMLANESLILANDGVGAWAQRDRGHAPLWSRLIGHFWALAAEKDLYGGKGDPDPVRYLDEAYKNTKEALSDPNEWHGTTTVSAAILHYTGVGDDIRPVLYVTQLGDCKILVVRPTEKGKEPTVLFASVEQWHYFDCPRQLGTNSPDTPQDNAVLDKVEIIEGDLILAMSDGVTDNLWVEEIADYAVGALQAWKEKETKDRVGAKQLGDVETSAEAMKYLAQEVVLSARRIAEDPFAASPYMEKAVEEGLAIEGGKPDDISVVAAICKRRIG
jgi:serine/threonine protein phosphatase PrpC